MQTTPESISDVCVVLRSVGEKTERRCQSILERLFPEKNIFTVRNITPFSRAVSKTFEIGLEQNRQWTLAVDADVLFFEDKLRDFLNLADTCLNDDASLYCVLGLLFDKFSNRAREVGFHLYNTKLLSKALRFVNGGENHLRPETYVKYRMEKQGHSMLIVSMKIGVHDFFQYKRSIVKKALLLVRKNSAPLVSSMISLWKERETDDADFHYALQGAALSERLGDIFVKVDAAFIDNLLHQGRIMENFQEDDDIDEALLQSTLENLNDDNSEVIPVRSAYPLRSGMKLWKHLHILTRRLVRCKRCVTLYRRISQNYFEKAGTK